ncbi:MAG: hypothetical protein ACLRMZ_03050 [Blautia marasmi]
MLLLDTDFVHEGLKASGCEYFYIHFRHPQIYRREVQPGFMENLLQIREPACSRTAVPISGTEMTSCGCRSTFLWAEREAICGCCS